MAKTKAPYRQSQITLVVKALNRAGFPTRRAQITSDAVILDFRDTGDATLFDIFDQADAESSERNEWDEYLETQGQG